MPHPAHTSLRRTPTRAVDDPESIPGAYAAGLQMLAGRELSAAQVRDRLARRGYAEAAVAGAVERLIAAGALDEGRMARALARSRAQVKRQGRGRVVRELLARGIDRDTAEQATADVFAGVDERRLLDEALARRLRSASLSDPAVQRRVTAALVRQGFSPGAIRDAIRSRTRGGRRGDEDRDG